MRDPFAMQPTEQLNKEAAAEFLLLGIERAILAAESDASIQERLVHHLAVEATGIEIADAKLLARSQIDAYWYARGGLVAQVQEIVSDTSTMRYAAAIRPIADTARMRSDLLRKLDTLLSTVAYINAVSTDELHDRQVDEALMGVAD